MSERFGWRLYFGGAILLMAVGAVPGTFGQASSSPAPAAQKAMASDADPSFDVSTIKPSNGDGQGKYFRVMGRQYLTHNTSLADLVELAYGVHPKQIVGAPAWMFGDKFDLVATPDGEGQPNGRQWLGMIQKLMADRFKLVLHRDKQPLSVYVLQVAKGGPVNLTPSQSANPFPSLEFRSGAGGLLLPAKNTTLGSFCQMMQQVVLDRPLVDQTGIAGKFDFNLTFAPDDSQFNGHPPQTAAPADAAHAPPGLLEAMQQQLGLKLSVEKIATDVLVIDKVEKPSAN
jgi:uncharacterized protein (TIGR03435 family)